MIDHTIIPGEVAPSLLSVTSALARPPSSLRGRGTSARPWLGHRSADIMSDMVAGAGAVAGEWGRLAQGISDCDEVSLVVSKIRVDLNLSGID